MAVSEQIKPCTCGSKATLFYGIPEESFRALVPLYEVRCQTCERRTGYKVTAEYAIEVWNGWYDFFVENRR